MNLRKRLEVIERTLKRRPEALSLEGMTDDQLLASVAEASGLTREQRAALSDEELDALLLEGSRLDGKPNDDPKTFGTS